MGPERTCIGCRRTTDPVELVRISLQDGTLRLGRGLPGRGAWLCRDVGCLDAAIRRGAIGRALRTTVTATMTDDLRSAFGDPPVDARG